MKITNISCMQFAGVRNRNVSFTEGINVIYGRNESGKSTLVNLISRTLFQRAKLDGRSDRDFMDRYFPGAKKGGVAAGDFVDGTVTFETEQGTYTLSKEWGADARCTLSTPDGVLRDQKKIEQILKTVLLYGEGVYSDLLFSSQRNTDTALQTLLDVTRKTDAKQEVADVVSRAFAESDGVSVDAIGQAIQSKIEEIAGKHWDPERDAPVRKAGRWATGLGEILKAYYALEDAKDALEQIFRLEQDADRRAGDYAAADEAARIAEEAYQRFQAVAGLLTVRAERAKTLERLESELRKIRNVLSQWPQLEQKLEMARKLRSQLADRRVLDMWNGIRRIREEWTREDEEASRLPLPDTGEFTAVKQALRQITALENKLCGMNLNVAVQMLGGHSIRVTSLVTGAPVDVSDGLAAITEAVSVEIPGVAVMELTPANVDVASVRAQIDAHKQTVQRVFDKYQVETLEALEAYARKIETAKAKAENIENRIGRVLGSCSMEELTEQYGQVGPVDRTAGELEREIFALCGAVDIGTFIAKTETVIDGYVREYGSIKDLKVMAFDGETERSKVEQSLADAQELPAEYRGIADPDAHLAALRENWKNKQQQREDALTQKTFAASLLEVYKEDHPEACPETVEKARQTFEEIRSLLAHWRHIEAVFLAQKETLHANPMQDLADRFTHYLGVISDGAISSEFPEGDKLNMLVYSGNTLLDYGKLSEGTKETVSLAFRLAVLDHLFPEGGGVIVFDDPFTDMDAQRTARSCQLLQACAQRHQVIFLTCKEEYLDLLSGNCIRFQS